MDNNSFQTSFIPKKPINQGISGVSGKEPVGFFSVITTIILIISILASGGLFGYKLYLTKQKEKLSSSLLISRDSFEKDTINELDVFYQRSKAARDILNNHVVLSPVFSLLDDITIPQVQYTNFDQQINDKGVFTVSISGVASDYKSIALQSNMFNTEKGSPFKDVLFSNLVKDKDGNVAFSLKFTIDKSLYSYQKNILSNSYAPSDSNVVDTPSSATNEQQSSSDNTTQPIPQTTTQTTSPDSSSSTTAPVSNSTVSTSSGSTTIPSPIMPMSSTDKLKDNVNSL